MYVFFFFFKYFHFGTKTHAQNNIRSVWRFPKCTLEEKQTHAYIHTRMITFGKLMKPDTQTIT